MIAGCPTARVEGRGPGSRRYPPPDRRREPSNQKAVTVHRYCTCGHTVAEHANGGQCRANEDGARCLCQSVDCDEEA